MGRVLEELKEEILESLKSDSKNIERTWVNRVKQVAQVLKIKIVSIDLVAFNKLTKIHFHVY